MASRRCPVCRGSGFSIRNGAGLICETCAGTGVLAPHGSDIPQAVRAKVSERSGGMCEICYKHRATDKHHRRFRSRRGQHTVENLLDVCGPGNTFGCHGRAHGADPLEGTAIPGWDRRSEQEIPFVDELGYTWVLHPDGTKEKVR